MLSIASIAVPARCALLESTGCAPVDSELIVLVASIAFGGMDLDLPEIIMYSRCHDGSVLKYRIVKRVSTYVAESLVLITIGWNDQWREEKKDRWFKILLK